MLLSFNQVIQDSFIYVNIGVSLWPVSSKRLFICCYAFKSFRKETICLKNPLNTDWLLVCIHSVYVQNEEKRARVAKGKEKSRVDLHAKICY